MIRSLFKVLAIGTSKAVVGIVLVALSCVRTFGGGSITVVVSRDGARAAFLGGERTTFPTPPEAATLRQKVWLNWADTAKPDQIKRVDIATVGPSKSGYNLAGETQLSFSPDGQHIAVACPERFMVVDLNTKHTQDISLGHETLSSLCWLDNSTLGYVTAATVGKGQQQRTTRTFWRQTVSKQLADRTVIHADRDLADPPPLREYWSPDGRYVLYHGPSRLGQPLLMEVQTGEVRQLGKAKDRLRRASWKRDGSGVFWTGASGDDEDVAFLVKLPGGETVDLSRQVRNAFPEVDYGLNLEPAWTPDGQYVVGSDLGVGGYLIRPEPWEVRFVGRNLGSNLGLKRTTAPGELNAECNIFVRPQDAPGMLTARPSMDELVIDYDGQVRKKLDAGLWTILPDGKRAIRRDYEKLVVVPLE